MLHPKPDDGWFGDPIPYYWEGVWHLFYLRDQQHHALPGGRHVWGHFASRDLVNWEEMPLAIPLGDVGAPDSASCGTGSIIERDGVFHLYYLGRYFASNGDRETICHATSRDLVTWEKDPANPISRPDPARYGLADWRDAFPFWNEEAGEYWMIVTATLRDGPASRRGCLALLASPDLGQWTLRKPFWAPHLGYDHECPDLFRWGDWWYLVYSTGGDPTSSGTLYRRARQLGAGWEADSVEALEGPLFYAGKTAFDGKRRMLFGWVPTRERDDDAGRVQWGGHGAIREVVQAEDGSLLVRCPPEILESGGRIPTALTPRLGSWGIEDGGAAGWRSGGLSYATMDGIPESFSARVSIRPTARTSRFGLFLRTDPTLERGYMLGVEPYRERVTLAPFGARGRAAGCGLSRPLPMVGCREVEVVVVVDGSIVEAYVDGRLALCGRFYDHHGGTLGLFVEDGGGEFLGLDVRALAQS